MKKCLYCGKELTKEQRKNKYCSRECFYENKRNSRTKLWLSGELSGSTKTGSLSQTFRNYLIKQANNACEICGWNKKNPVTDIVPLEIHHKDGNSLNNNYDNLQVLCPNCHALTPNFRNLNQTMDPARIRGIAKKHYCIDCGNPVSGESIRCKACYIKYHREQALLSIPTREELKNLIRKETFVSIGLKYNVTDNAVKKWCISYNLPSRKRDIKLYADEEWENI